MSTTERKAYSYPDPQNHVTSGYEPFPGYWARSEERLMRVADELLAAQPLPRGRPRRFLDAGCGDGRLVPRFEGRFDEGVALDADRERLGGAARMAQGTHYAQKVRFLPIGADEFHEDEPFDFILCNHVVQHVHTSKLPRIVARLRALLAPGGVLLLATSHSRTGEDHFSEVHMEDGRLVERLIGRRKFDRLVTNDQGMLPVHHLTRTSFLRLLEAHSFQVRHFQVYHELGPLGDLDRRFDRDWVINLAPELQDAYGHDMAAVCTV